MTAIPVVCDDCGHPWASEGIINVADGAQAIIMMQGNTVSPCPYCGGTGSIPDGEYRFAEGVVQYLADPNVSVGTLQRLQAWLLSAQARGATAEEVAQVVEENAPGLGQYLRAAEPIAARWVAVLLAILTLLLAYKQEHARLTPQQVTEIVQKVIEQQQPAP